MDFDIHKLTFSIMFKWNDQLKIIPERLKCPTVLKFSSRHILQEETVLISKLLAGILGFSKEIPISQNSEYFCILTEKFQCSRMAKRRYY